MTQYIISYLGGEPPATPEEGHQNFARYREWLAGLGDAAVSPANPLKDTVTISPDRTIAKGSTTSMSGYTLIEVDSMDAALELAGTCPFLDTGGSLEVSEVMEMPR